MPRVLLVAATTGYQTRVFADAARHLGYDLILATDRCHVLEDPWGDRAIPVRFEDPYAARDVLAANGPFDANRRKSVDSGKSLYCSNEDLAKCFET